MIHYRSEEEIDLIRESSLLVAKTHAEISALIKPGVTTLQLDKIAEEFNTTAIEFSSSRNGWKKIAKNLGYEMVTQLYRKEV